MCRSLVALSCVSLLSVGLVDSSDAESPEKPAGITSAGPLAFSPDGIMFVADAKQATIFAFETGDFSGAPHSVQHSVDAVNEKLAARLGVSSDELLINDIAVNPASGSVYFSVTRGRGPQGIPVIMRANGEGELSEFRIDRVQSTSVSLSNPPEDAVRGEGRRRRNSRMESITDLAFLDGQVFIAGLSNEEFASKLRAVDYPFDDADEGTSVEIFHGAHGKYETRSPVRTFAPYVIEDEPHLLAAYTCTPLVKFPISMLTSGEKIQGTTVAELGNRNRPLDMIIYQKDGKDYVLMANSSRGLMKISVEGVADIEGITEHIRGTAGLEYETLSDIDGVVQLDRLDKERAVILVQSDDGVQNLSTIDLP